jgi:hypothetical protein
LQTGRYGWDIQTVPVVRTVPFLRGRLLMVRHATNEALTVPAGARIERTLRVQADEEGVLDLDGAFLAGLRGGDALGVPGPLPTCESCWTEPTVAVALWPGDVVAFRGAACAAEARQAGARLVPLVAW